VSDSSAGTAQYASSRPASPPAVDRIVLSVSNWRMMRPRPAPSAARTAISRPRPDARASSRLAVFAHAIKSSIPTALTIISSGGRTARDWLS
jgi:hypothetical protein